jgi:predicted transcriptional regulator YheO
MKPPDKDQFIFEHYLRVAEVLGKMFTPYLEVIVHDLRKPVQSIIGIYNGHITGREVGGPTTDLGFKRVEGGVPDMIVNYNNKNDRGLNLKSSSLAIKNREGELIGSLCLNLNISVFHEIGNIVSKLVETEKNPFIDDREVFHPKTPEDEIVDTINEITLNHSMNATNLSKNDKIKIVGELYRRKDFNKRGAVFIVAKHLKLSKPTVYKYIKIANREQGVDAKSDKDRAGISSNISTNAAYPNGSPSNLGKIRRRTSI